MVRKTGIMRATLVISKKALEQGVSFSPQTRGVFMNEKHKFLIGGLGLLSGLLLAGCPGGDEPGDSPKSDMYAMPDMTEDAPGDLSPTLDDSGLDVSPDAPDLGMDMSCVPHVTCPVDRCGEVSDGCGGTLFCTPCACNAGVPTVSTCGSCDLGLPRCQDEKVLCEEPPLEIGILGNCRSSIIYIDSSYEGISSGTKEEPFKSIARAITDVGDDEQIRLYVLRRGTYTEPHLRLPAGVSLVGGFDSMWRYNGDEVSTIRVTGSDEPSSRGILLEEGQRNATFANLKVKVISTPDGSLYVTPLEIRNAQGVSLVGVETTSIEGVRGAPGINGTAGASGAKGGDAELRSFAMPEKLLARGSAPDAPLECLGSTGGDGGIGASVDLQVRASEGETPRNNIRVAGEAGTSSSVAGKDGGSGTIAANLPLKEVVLPTGMYNWGQDGATFTHFKDGEDGEDGIAGGGGTGGGGAWRFTDSQGTTFSGGSGGGGGAGGCGGKKGTGGQGGGSSFGIVIVNAPDTRINNSSFKALGGGDGGAAGRGGRGGQGGAGGQGTFSQNNPGGDGGPGGAGQAGSDGAPGAGGFSSGMLCNQVLQIKPENSTSQGSIPGRGAQTVDGMMTASDGQARDQMMCW